MSDWQKLYGPTITEAIVSGPHEELGGGTVETWTVWRELGLRVLVNEISTAFGLAIGGRHSADCVGGFARALTPNGKRLDIADFDTFLRNLFFKDPASGTDVTFGALWAPLEELPAKPRGEDVGLVCIIARTPYWSGTNVGWLYAAGLGEEREHRMMVGLGFDVEPMRLTARAPVILAAIVAHESAHTFGCGDEYAGDCSHGQPRDTSDTGNTQLATENGLQSAPPAIDVTKIKWQWPRIAKAGVLRSDATAPDPAHPEILKLELGPGHSAFTDGASPDVLRLRARPLVSNPQASKLLKVTAVLRDPVNGDTLTVEQVEGFPPAIDLTPFVASSLVFAPALPGTAPAVDGTLVHPDVLAHIGTTNGPLNAPAGSPTRDCAIDFASQPKPHLYNIQIPTNLPPSMKTGTRVQPTWGSWIVGLYEGAPAFLRHLPSHGACAMRSFAVPRKTLWRRAHRRGVRHAGPAHPAPGIALQVLRGLPVRPRRHGRSAQASDDRSGVRAHLPAMSDESTLHIIARHLALAVASLREATRDLPRFRAFMRRLGWTATSLPPSYAELGQRAADALAAVEALADDPTLQEILDAIEQVGAVYRAAQALADAPGGVDAGALLADFGEGAPRVPPGRVPRGGAPERLPRAGDARRHPPRAPRVHARPAGARPHPPALRPGPRGARGPAVRAEPGLRLGQSRPRLRSPGRAPAVRAQRARLECLARRDARRTGRSLPGGRS